jgi:uncharacterized protein (DUF302 family)
MREKLDLDMTKSIIPGVCNPPNAYKAILVEESTGRMLPCNVIVYEKGSMPVLFVIRPTVAMQMIENSNLRIVAEGVEPQLKNAFDAIK